MAGTERPRGFSPSLFDKLTDPRSRGSGDRIGFSEAQMLRSVVRDLTNLLSTRRPTETTAGIDGLPEVERSVLNYGLPDLGNINPSDKSDQERVAAQIAAAIRDFEPRLTDVKVVVKDRDQLRTELGERFRFTAGYVHISARLSMKPLPPVAFERVLELAAHRRRDEGGA